MLNQTQAHLLLKKYNLTYPKYMLTTTFPTEWNIFPCVLKIDSAAIVHKSDQQVVWTNIANKHELKNSVATAKKKAQQLHLESYQFLLQEQVHGVELLIGMHTDPVFGKTLVFGVGGVFVELYKDVVMRILPLTKKEMRQMLNEITAQQLFKGFRNLPIPNKKLLVDTISNAGTLAINEEITSFDFNPVIANDKKIYVADARFIP